jgi:pimeloyl-ACP methyl ester carboxylesterase
VLDTIAGPVILVSHAYGGAVITQAGDDPKVKALIYAGSPMPGVGNRQTIVSYGFAAATSCRRHVCKLKAFAVSAMSR